MKKKNKKNRKKRSAIILRMRQRENSKKPGIFFLPTEVKNSILGVVIFIAAIIIALSFFDLAGVAGKALISGLTFLIGKATFITPLILVLGGLVFLTTRYEKYFGPAILAILIVILGIAGILESLNQGTKQGGWMGYIFNFPLSKLFGALVSKVVFSGVILVGILIFWHLIRPFTALKKIKTSEEELKKEEKPFIARMFSRTAGGPRFKIKEVEPKIKEAPIFKTAEPFLGLKSKPITSVTEAQYKTPPLELLETDKGRASAGDVIANSAIIKKTLENFGLGVEMSEINVGPTVTQYTLKPADGIKLSKITALSNNLSLALASHPIRIEAPIPGKSLVGVEVPNKQRCQVRLRDLIANPLLQKTTSNLTLVLGKDVSGNPCYADLSRMPHLLVAGATGTGKTIFLNSLILSLLYQNSPKILRFILIDPKRVEFSAYKGLPHLLCPVIFDPQRTVLAFKWLTSEMERRFNILSGNGSRDISSYNDKVLKMGEEPLPYIVLIIDELADLMAAKGREVEVGIVRLAQMARAVGIHLVLATQRPSVEVITGLIKANITSRITFQVASQVDSRTVLDTGGAEKLLGLGDLLFISAEVVKPRRIQGAYVSEKEVRRVIEWIKEQFGGEIIDVSFENHLSQELEKSLEEGERGGEFEEISLGEDPLYEDAKKIVIEAKKASASLLQRRLRIGYARAARLLDTLEQRRIVGPGDGAKPREVYFDGIQNSKIEIQNEENDNSNGEEWHKV